MTNMTSNRKIEERLRTSYSNVCLIKLLAAAREVFSLKNNFAFSLHSLFEIAGFAMLAELAGFK